MRIQLCVASGNNGELLKELAITRIHCPGLVFCGQEVI